MKKFESEVWVSVFNNGWDLISQVNGYEVTFSGKDMYVWRDRTICACYDLSKYKEWRIIDKGFDTVSNKWSVRYFLDI